VIASTAVGPSLHFRAVSTAYRCLTALILNGVSRIVATNCTDAATHDEIITACGMPDGPECESRPTGSFYHINQYIRQSSQAVASPMYHCGGSLPGQAEAMLADLHAKAGCVRSASRRLAAHRARRGMAATLSRYR
jgi:hypothetical protein